MAKHNCAICGAEVGLMSGQKLADGDYRSMFTIIIPDPEDEEDELVWFRINAMEADHENFRCNLRRDGFDQYEYIVNNAYETVAVGGLDFLLVDGNMREILLYTKDGTYIGVCKLNELCGTGYPWPCDATVTEDGSILVIMTDERQDQSADELIAFKISGF